MVFLDELRTVLLDERDSGDLTTISPDLFIKTNQNIKSLQQEVYSLEDPFSDEARFLIEKVSSIRATIEELFKIRTDKIVGLALSQAEGSYIEREELRSLIPAELEMFNQFVGAIRLGKSQLIGLKAGSVAPVQAVADGSNQVCHIPTGEPEEGFVRAGDDTGIVPEQKMQNEVPFVYDIVQALSSMDPFMGVDGRTYELRSGDILTLPSRNAQVLVERDIVLNIHPG